jgi:hypothetical protein
MQSNVHLQCKLALAMPHNLLCSMQHINNHCVPAPGRPDKGLETVYLPVDEEASNQTPIPAGVKVASATTVLMLRMHLNMRCLSSEHAVGILFVTSIPFCLICWGLQFIVIID